MQSSWNDLEVVESKFISIFFSILAFLLGPSIEVSYYNDGRCEIWYHFKDNFVCPVSFQMTLLDVVLETGSITDVSMASNFVLLEAYWKLLVGTSVERQRVGRRRVEQRHGMTPVDQFLDPGYLVCSTFGLLSSQTRYNYYMHLEMHSRFNRRGTCLTLMSSSLSGSTLACMEFLQSLGLLVFLPQSMDSTTLRVGDRRDLSSFVHLWWNFCISVSASLQGLKS